MSSKGLGFFDRVAREHAQSAWRNASEHTHMIEQGKLLELMDLARETHQATDRFITNAEKQLDLGKRGGETWPDVTNRDRAWRPSPWREPIDQAILSSVHTGTKIGDEVTLFHDCSMQEFTIRQFRADRQSNTPFGLMIDVYQFGGSFLSLVCDLPDGFMEGLTKSHIISVIARPDIEAPTNLYARLNISSGPNTENILREMRFDDRGAIAEFDLAYAEFNDKRLEKAWIDIIIEKPRMNQLQLNDLAVLRSIRAPL